MKRAQIKPLSKAPFKKGDQVQVTAGKAKGQVGEVLRVDLARHTVVVKDINTVKRHSKPRSQNDAGGIITMEAPIHTSNVLPYCEACSRGVRKVCEKPASCKNKKK